jgi:hypothetical protein
MSNSLKPIIPTIGRRLWYIPSIYDLGGMLEKPTTIIEASNSQPCDAGVVFVHGDRLVNLSVTDHNGNVHKRTSVTLVQPGETPPEGGGYCKWMDYQAQQAAPKPQASTTAKYFAFAHLPQHLQLVSQPLSQLAALLEELLPGGPEKSAGMRKLLEAKDCFVRAALELPPAELLAKALITDSDRLSVIYRSLESDEGIQVDAPENVIDEIFAIEGPLTSEAFYSVLDKVILLERQPKLNTEDPDHAEA